MAPIQTTYPSTLRRAVPGMIEGSDYNTGTGVCEVVAGLDFGRPVAQGVSERGVIAAGNLATFIGITVRDVALGAEVDKIPQYSNLSYVKQGQIAVLSAAAGIIPGDPVHYDPNNGEWMKTGGQGPIVGARYISAGGVGDVVIIELQAK